ncbi:hypothetical protein CVT24_002539 [Panaeolus cyanescens]|uniref:DNA 3'-5' helicase n=1 Tax=Panaeolus cyanescens TaxID=181874 RepID=A0A409WB07_9AGAR|nr:hypothetical protein CVT24_002539 [Panaeolus cyanescens]
MSSSDRMCCAIKLPLLTHDGTGPAYSSDLLKTIIFINSVPNTQLWAKKLRHYLPSDLGKYVDVLHSLHTTRSKRRVMRAFRYSGIKILVATEAAGMGADIPDVERVIQFGVPDSLSVWEQRAALLLVEESVFKQRQRTSKSASSELAGKPVVTGNESDEGIGSADSMNIDDSEKARERGEGDVESVEDHNNDRGADEESSMVEEADEVDEHAGEGNHTTSKGEKDMMWMKKADPDLRTWLHSEACRRDGLDESYFNNPPERKGISVNANTDTILSTKVDVVNTNTNTSSTTNVNSKSNQTGHG